MVSPRGQLPLAVPGAIPSMSKPSRASCPRHEMTRGSVMVLSVDHHRGSKSEILWLVSCLGFSTNATEFPWVVKQPKLKPRAGQASICLFGLLSTWQVFLPISMRHTTCRGSRSPCLSRLPLPAKLLATICSLAGCGCIRSIVAGLIPRTR